MHTMQMKLRQLQIKGLSWPQLDALCQNNELQVLTTFQSLRHLQLYSPDDLPQAEPDGTYKIPVIRVRYSGPSELPKRQHGLILANSLPAGIIDRQQVAGLGRLHLAKSMLRIVGDKLELTYVIVPNKV